MIKKTEIFITPFSSYRQLHIYLPDDYYKSSQSYPVIYMFDGHNLFNDEDASYGHSWHISDYLDENELKVIVIGLECNHEGNYRLWEYSPYSFMDKYWGKVQGQGKETFQWITTELKAWVDNNYRTLTDRENTAIGGSSMGGLMAIYGISKFNTTFSKAICVSSFTEHVQKKLIKDLNKTKMDPNTKVYLSYGTRETGSFKGLEHMCKDHSEIINYFNGQKVDLYVNVILKGIHSETAWEKEVSTFMEYLF